MSSWRFALVVLAALFAPSLSAGREPPNAAPAHGPLQSGVMARLGAPRFRHIGGVVCLAYAPHGDTVASAGQDATIRIWDMTSGRELRRWRPANEMTKCLAWSPDGKLLAAGGEWGLALWDPSNGQKVAQLDEGKPTVLSIAFAPDGKSLADGGAGGIRLWDLANRKTRRVWWTQQWVRSLAFSPDGATLLLGGDDGRIHLWDVVKDGSKPRQLGEQTEPIRAVACAPDGKTMAAAAGKTVSLWDWKSAKRLALIKASRREINSVAFSPDGKILATAGADGIMDTWLAHDGSELMGTGDGGILRSVSVSPDSQTILSAGDSGSFHRLQFQIEISGKNINIKTVGKEELRIEALTFAPDGRSLAVLSNDGTVRLWDITHRKERGCLRDPRTPLHGLAFSPDAKILAASSDRVVHFWDTMSARELRALPHTAGRVASIIFSDDGNYLALAGSFTKNSGNRVAVRILDLKHGEETQKLSVPAGVELAMTFLPGGRTLATWSGALTFWDAATGADITRDFVGEDLASGRKRYPGLVSRRSDSRTPLWVGGVFSPNGRLLVVFSVGGEVHVFDTMMGLEHCHFGAGITLNGEVSFSPDSRFLYIRMVPWEANTGGRLPMLWDLQRPIDAWALSPDGTVLAAGMRDGTIELRDLRPSEWSGVRKTGLQPWEWRRCRKELLSSDACWLADRAAWMLAADAEQTLPMLKSSLHRFSTETRIRQLIRDLDSESFPTRQAALRELRGIGAAAEPALLRAWRDKPSLELRRRMKELLEDIERHRMVRPTGERLRSVRAIGVLERIGTKEARAVLEDLAHGGEGAWETWEAQEALRRLRLHRGD